MYLTEIDEKTGLVKIEKSKDGILAIKEFRDIIHDEKLGIECFTAIALVADYLSLKRFYDDNDRPRASMEEVTGDRDKFVWKQEKIQKALVKYDDLQYDADIEEERLHRLRKTNVLRKIKEAEKMNVDEMIAAGYNMKNLTATLRDINADIVAFDKRTNKNSMFGHSPVENGYSLSRLEQKLKKKRSFYNEINENVV